MPVFGMRLKVCRSSAKAKADYVERENKYKNGVKAEDLVYCEEHNLPSWAENAHDFFHEMDKQERTTKEKEGTETDPDKKKVKCRELVFTLPSKLEREDQIQLTKEYCQKVFGEDHVYTFAIHENRGSLSGEKNPHVHVVFSDRKIDPDREVKREDFCRQRTGYKKDPLITGSQRKEWLHKIRVSLAEKQNAYLERAGIKDRVDPRSYKDRGIDKIPQPKIGFKAVAMGAKGKDISNFPQVLRYKSIIEENSRKEARRKIEAETKKLDVTTGEKITSGLNYLALKAHVLVCESEKDREKALHYHKSRWNGNREGKKRVRELVMEETKERSQEKIKAFEQHLKTPSNRFDYYSVQTLEAAQRLREQKELERKKAEKQKELERQAEAKKIKENYLKKKAERQRQIEEAQEKARQEAEARREKWRRRRQRENDGWER